MSPSAKQLEVEPGDVVWFDSRSNSVSVGWVLSLLNPSTSRALRCPVYYQVTGPIKEPKNKLLGDPTFQARRFFPGLGPDQRDVEFKAQVDYWDGKIMAKDRIDKRR